MTIIRNTCKGLSMLKVYRIGARIDETDKDLTYTVRLNIGEGWRREKIAEKKGAVETERKQRERNALKMKAKLF